LADRVQTGGEATRDSGLVSDDAAFHGLCEAALEIATRRAETLARLRVALENGKDAEALRIARELCGVEHEQKRH